MNIIHRICNIIPFYYSELGMKGVSLFLFSKCSGRKPVVAIRVPGIAHPVSIRIGTTDLATFKQVLVERHYEFDKPDAPRFIIDAGANIGLASVYFANRYPQAKIVSIEPETSNFEMLRKNTAAYPQITPLQAALWRKNEELFLFDSGHGNHGFQVGDAQGERGEAPNHLGGTPGLTVDTILRNAGQNQVDLLKIDIEGAEREVMSSATEWIDRVGVLMIELHDDIKPGCTDAFHAATRHFSEEVVRGETIMLHSSLTAG
jgi:FkbM family methyltransferase